MFGVMVFLIVFTVIMFFMPEMGGYFLEYNNFIPADPLKTPEHIAPVWYFTPYYSILRAVPPIFGLAVPRRGGDGRGDADPLRAAVARPRPGEVDPLPRPALQRRGSPLSSSRSWSWATSASSRRPCGASSARACRSSAATTSRYGPRGC